MNNASPTIFWDFDGTLVEGPRWGRTMLKALEELHPDHGVTYEHTRSLLREGFPWHYPETPHPELSRPEDWWEYLEYVIVRAYCGMGLNDGDAALLARTVHELMLEPGEYRTYEDTLEALHTLAGRGWRHIILSNNFPELERVLEHLPISEFINECISSGIIGYEKPHPAAFFTALERAGYPEQVWMVGDNIMADVRGAESAGIPAILVRKTPEEPVAHFAADLLEAASIILDST